MTGCITIRKAKNGFSLNIPSDKQDDWQGEDFVFNSVPELLAKVARKLGDASTASDLEKKVVDPKISARYTNT